MYFSKYDQQRSNQLYALLCNVNFVIMLFPPTMRSVLVSMMGLLVLDEIFLYLAMSSMLQEFPQVFESKSSTHIQGKNISVITKQLYADVVSLDEVGT